MGDFIDKKEIKSIAIISSIVFGAMYAVSKFSELMSKKDNQSKENKNASLSK